MQKTDGNAVVTEGDTLTGGGGVQTGVAKLQGEGGETQVPSPSWGASPITAAPICLHHCWSEDPDKSLPRVGSPINVFLIKRFRRAQREVP